MRTFSKYFLLLVIGIERLFRYGFNTNTGYFYYAKIYWYDGKPETGYVICKGYRMFWINGYDKIEVAGDDESLRTLIKGYEDKGFKVPWKQI